MNTFSFIKVSSLLLIMLLAGITGADGRTVNTDSLLIVLQNTKEDSSRIKTLNALVLGFRKQDNTARAMEYARQALVVAQTAERSPRVLKHLAQTCIFIGLLYTDKDEYDKAIAFYHRALKISEAAGDKKGIAGSCQNLGIIYYNKADYDKALEFYLKAARAMELAGDKRGLAASYNNVANVYYVKDDEDKALKYYLTSVAIKQELQDTLNAHYAHMLSNVGLIYTDNSEYDKAMELYLRAQRIREEIGNREGSALSYNAIGSIWDLKGDYAKALDFYLKAVEIQEEIGDSYETSSSCIMIGRLYLKMSKVGESRKWHMKSLELAKEVEAKSNIMEAYEGLMKADSALGNFKGALEHHRLHIAYRDSVHNAESEKKMMQAEMQHEYEKKEAIAKAEQQKKDALYQAELGRQTMQRNAFIGGFALMLTLAAVSYRSYRSKKKANTIISMQKEEVEQQKILVEEKNHEILNSITYARRLQEAILPPQKLVSSQLPQSFILYKPKDIVAGDFYWLESLTKAMDSEGKIVLFAAADCTGHGVPGAMVSVVCSNALNRTVKEFGITDPGKILDKVRELVIETFEKSENEVKDGMDISLCALDMERKMLTWAGANNPLWIVRSGQLLETRADKQPIGKYAEEKPFTTHSMQLQEGDMIYIFTDGYADQFGGPKGKKFKYSQLKELLLSIQQHSMDKQQLILDQTFENWRGDLEQVDDVCIVGVKVV